MVMEPVDGMAFPGARRCGARHGRLAVVEHWCRGIPDGEPRVWVSQPPDMWPYWRE